MKKSVFLTVKKMAVVITVILAGLVSFGSLKAQTTISSLTIGAPTGSATYGTAGSVIFPISFTTTGSGVGSAVISLEWTPLPAGVTTSFPVTIDPSTFVSPVYLTVTTTNATPAGNFSFLVTSTSGAEPTAQTIGTFIVVAKPLTLTDPVANNKVYNGTNAATITGTLTGIVGLDVVTLNGTGTFADINVANGIAVTSTSTLAGAQASNYSLTQPSGLTANITAKALTLPTAAASNKVYNGNNAGTIAGILSGIVGSDAVTLNGTGTFASIDVANGIAFTSTSTLSGAQSGNYTLTQPIGLTANITPKALTLTNPVAGNKIYNGTNAAIITGTLTGIVGADAVTLNGTGTFASVNAANGIAVTSTSTLAGAKAGNYSLTQPTGLTANITKKNLTLGTPAASNKAYDGTNAATITGTLTGIVGTDVVTLVGTGTFASINVANGIVVTSTCSLAGAKAGNYTLTQPVGLTANITAKALTIGTPVATNKVYDGTDAAIITGTLTGIAGSDVVTLSGTGTFASANVGTGIAVTSTSTIGGAGAANYTLTQPIGLVADITSIPLTITGIAGVNKVYNGTTAGIISGTPELSAGVLPADVPNVVLGGTPVVNWETATAGLGKPLIITGFTISGSAAGNYSLTQPTGLTASITRKALTIGTPLASNKVYDGTDDATITGTLTGIVGADVVTLVGTGTFASINVASGIVVTSAVTLAGAQSGNYKIVTQPSGLTADITAKELTIATPVASNKVYDATNTATLTGTLNGVVSPDVVALTLTGTFASLNVGNGIAVTSTSTIGGAGAGNYTLTQPAGLTANITRRPLTITGLTGANRVYNGTTLGAVSGTATLVGVLAGETANVALGGTPTVAFATASVGNAKPLTITGYTISGSASGNYSLTQPTGVTANITARTITLSSPFASNKVYNGTLITSITGTLTGVISPDVVTLNGTGTFANKNVGIGIPVTSICSLAGAQGGNYTLTQPTGLSANITPMALTVTATGPVKIYGNSLTTFTSTTDFITGATAANEVVTSVILRPNADGILSTTPAGASYIVTPSQAAGTGGFVASNYTITYVPFTGIVSPKPITVTAVAGQRKLIGTADPVFAYTFAPALLGTDTFTGTLSRVAGETVEGGPYAITIGTLTAGSNYLLTLVSSGFTITSASEALITAFNFTILPNYPEVINQTNGTIAVPVKYSATVASLIATFTASPGAVVRVGGVVQTSGSTMNNHTSVVSYVVTSSNGLVSKTYQVTVNKNAALTDKQLLTLEFPGIQGSVGVINQTNYTVSVHIPLTLNVTDLVAAFTVSPLANVQVNGVLQTSGATSNNFTAALSDPGFVYTIVAENGSTRNYNVRFVRDAARTDKQLLSFSVSGINGAIDEFDHTVLVRVPFTFDISHAVATFTNSFMSTVKIGTITQISGVTSNSFTTPLVYIVTAESGVIQNYTVTVIIDAGNAAKDLVYFAFEDMNPDVQCEINQTAMTITGIVPNGTNRASMRAFFMTNSPLTTVRIPNGGGIQQSGITINDFRTPVIYEVTAANATTKNYTVTITESADVTPPIITNAAQTVSNLAGQFVLLRSNEAVGKVYIIHMSAAQTTVANLEASVAAGFGRFAYVTAANTDIPISTANMIDGTYYTYAIDASGNKSVRGINAITINDRLAPIVTVAAQTLSNALNHTVNVTSSETNAFVYLILEGVPQANMLQLNAAVNEKKGSRNLVQAANIPVAVSVYQLAPGNYHAYAVDQSVYNNLSAPSPNVVVITEASRAKSILAFSFDQLQPPAIGQISGTDILVKVRVGTPITNLVAAFSISPLSHAFIGTIEQVSGVTQNNFTTPVIYRVVAEDGSPLNYIVTVEFNTGIEESDWLNSIVSYPNPVSDNLTIETTRPLDRIVVINGLGQTIEDIRNPGQSTVQIHTDTWRTGIYFVRYYSDNKYIGIHKIIKN